MSGNILDIFDASLQKIQIWLKDSDKRTRLGRQAAKGLPRPAHALHALRDRLTVEETVHLGAQLPILIRGIYYEGWKLAGKPVKERRKSEFLDHVAKTFRDDETVDPEKVMRAVLKVLAKHISEGEAENVKHLLPKTLQELWPSSRKA
jgi:uncharacterized protein (DUF2267 family)